VFTPGNLNPKLTPNVIALGDVGLQQQAESREHRDRRSAASTP
jgi:hypothetical protein